MLLGIFGFLLLLGAVWGVRAWIFGRSHLSTDDAAVDGHVIPVVAKVGGYVAAVPVKENQQIAEGDLLVQLDTAELAMKLAQADADLAAARAAAGSIGVAGQAQAQVATATGQQSALQAQVAAARANATRAREDYRRMQELAAKQIISQQQLDAYRAAAESADAALSSAEKQASAATATISGAQAGTRLATARYQAALAARDNAALQLSYARITAPAHGVVARKSMEVGQLVQPGQPLMSVVADSGVWVTANYKETQVADMRIGQKVDIDVDAYGDCKAEGKLESISAATGSRFALLPPDNATGNFTKVVQRVPVRVAIVRGCGANRPLRPGMSVSTHVVTR